MLSHSRKHFTYVHMRKLSTTYPMFIWTLHKKEVPVPPLWNLDPSCWDLFMIAFLWASSNLFTCRSVSRSNGRRSLGFSFSFFCCKNKSLFSSSVPSYKFIQFYLNNTTFNLCNWAMSWKNLSYGIFEQQSHRSTCASAQSDQCLCCSLPREYNPILVKSKI